MNRRVLVTSAGSTAAQNLAHALGPGWWTGGVDLDAEHGGIGLFGDTAPVPRATDPAYLPALAAHATRWGVGLVVPVMEPELEAVAAATLPVPALVSPPEAIATCRSKRRLTEALGAAGVGVAALVDAPSRYPVFARPDRGTGSVGAERLDDADAVARRRRSDPTVVITEWLDGVEISVDGYAWRGSLAHCIARERERTKGGLAVSSVVVPAAPLRDDARRIARALGLHGFFNAQCRIVDGQARWFDVNPRLGGAMILSFAAGLDAAACVEAAIEGRPPKPGGDERVGLKLRRRWHNVVLPP